MAGSLWQWVVRHRLVKSALRAAAKRGESQARLAVDPEARLDPYPVYDRIRRRAPVVQGRLTMATARHDATSAILRSEHMMVGIDVDSVPWVLRKALVRPDDGRIVGPVDPPSLLAVNPPDHTRYRKLVSKVFTPRAIAALEPQVVSTADELLDELEGREVVDLVATYASLLPVTVISRILGVPLSMRDDVLTWGNAAAPSLDVGLGLREYLRVERGIHAFNEWMYGHIDRLRTAPGDDLLSRLVTLDADGERLTDKELVATAGLVLAAGFETTVNLLGTGTHLLATHPDQLALLREDPSLWPNAVDEMLRYESPVQNTARWAARDVEFGGVTVRKGTLVLVFMGGANRDPEVFENPDVFDVRRPNARDHLSFSAGLHYCVGAALARAEGRIGLQRLFDRYPDLALAGTPTLRSTRTLRGFETLPIAPGRPRRVPAVTA
jgi:cytochrome P450